MKQPDLTHQPTPWICTCGRCRKASDLGDPACAGSWLGKHAMPSQPCTGSGPEDVPPMLPRLTHRSHFSTVNAG